MGKHSSDPVGPAFSELAVTEVCSVVQDLHSCGLLLNAPGPKHPVVQYFAPQRSHPKHHGPTSLQPLQNRSSLQSSAGSDLEETVSPRMLPSVRVSVTYFCSSSRRQDSSGIDGSVVAKRTVVLLVGVLSSCASGLDHDAGAVMGAGGSVTPVELAA